MATRDATELLLRKSLSIDLTLMHDPARFTGRGGYPMLILEIFMGLWEYGFMKTTLELPDGLMQRVKLRAVSRNQKLKDAIAQLLELGMAASLDAGKAPRAPKPVRLKSGCLNIEDIEAAIGAGRE